MAKTIQTKREREKTVVTLMIRMYCKKMHHTKEGLCGECARLDAYARSRSDSCPFMEEKTFCSNCQVHCYKPAMREEICKVMRYSAPRMIFHRPIMSLQHLVELKKEKARIKKEEER